MAAMVYEKRLISFCIWVLQTLPWRAKQSVKSAQHFFRAASKLDTTQLELDRCSLVLGVIELSGVAIDAGFNEKVSGNRIARDHRSLLLTFEHFQVGQDHVCASLMVA